MADSQRKTANLFDESNGSYNAYVDDAGTWRYVDTAKSVKIPCLANTTYTLSVPENLSVFRIYEISDASADPPTQAAEIIRSGGIDNYTFTTASTTAAIIFQGSAGNFDECSNDLMLNTGSTPLPYEPYGWLHSLRKLDTATDTITTLPADVYADGTNATVGLVGDMSQSGTPTPTTPIQPSETGERTENLFNGITSATDKRIAVSTGGTYNSNGYSVSEYIPINPSTPYIINTSYGSYYSLYDGNKDYIDGEEMKSTVSTIATYSNAAFIRFDFKTADISSIVFVEGSTAPSSYIPYGYKLDIKSANTTTPVYLGEVETTRKIRKLVLTGNEIILRDKEREGSWRFFTDRLISAKGSAAICSHFENIGTDGVKNSDNIGFSIFNNAQFGCRCPKSIADTAADFKSYLAAQYTAGTPVTVWYVLAEPTTGIVNEPLRKIGDYADTVSGVSIPTTTGKDTFDVLTTLKPSEVSLAYTGWHDASVKEWDGSEWQ